MKTIFRLMTFAKKYWGSILLAFLCLIASTLLSLVTPKVLGIGIDALTSGTRSTLITAALIIVGASAAGGVVNFGNSYLMEAVAQKVSYDIRNALYNHVLRLSFSFHDQAQTGQLMSRATADVEAVRMFLAMASLALIQAVLMIIGVSYLLLTLNWRLALITLAFVPIIMWRAIYVSTKTRPIWSKVQQYIAALSTTLQESLMGIRVVKAFSRQKHESEKFATDARRLYEHQVSAARWMAANMPLMIILLSIPTAIILWYGGRQVIDGTLSISGLTQFILYIGMLSMPVTRMGMVVNTYARAVSAGNRIFEILDVESTVKEKPGALDVDKLKGHIIFENVHFSYNSKSPALKNINFEVQPGQLVALLGGSGSGKSTIANLMSRFYDVTSGRIVIDGIDIRDMTLASLRRNVRIAQQDVFLFSATIKDNIAYGSPNATMDEIIAAAKAAHIHDFIESLPQGYNTWVGERGFTLSGGEKQRLTIARALLLNPSILILDDTTSSVDAQTESLIYQALKNLIKDRTTFIITHRLPIIKNADIILVMKNGEIVEKGKHEELMTLKGLYYQTYNAQLEDIKEQGEILVER